MKKLYGRAPHLRVYTWDRSNALVRNPKVAFGVLPGAYIGNLRADALVTRAANELRVRAIRSLLHKSDDYAAVGLIVCPPYDSESAWYFGTMGRLQGSIVRVGSFDAPTLQDAEDEMTIRLTGEIPARGLSRGR